MNKFCPNCKMEFESGRFCPECGTRLEDIPSELICPVCGRIFETGKFCPECGARLLQKPAFIADEKGDLVHPDRVPGSVKACPNCGFENPADSTECVQCGYPLDSTAEPAAFMDAVETDDDAILAKYKDEYGDLRDLHDEEAPRAVQEITELAGKGNALAECFLASLYVDGKYVEQDYQKAHDLIWDADSKGEKLAALGKALFYMFGITVEQDLEQAEQLIDTAIDSFPVALYVKGMICSQRDEMKEAVKWFERAAEKGDRDGLLYLGYAYQSGLGDLPLDPVKAFECFSQSAALGNPEAENMLGVCYGDGFGVEPDERQALNWYRESARHNDADGQLNLAYAYKNGALGLEEDMEKAFELFKKSAEQGNANAMYEVAEFYDANYLISDKSVGWYQKAADAGHADAMFRLSKKYENGWGVEKNSEKAKELYDQAVAAGSQLAATQAAPLPSYLKWLDENGIAFQNDLSTEVFESFIDELHSDAENGDMLAQKLLGNCYLSGWGVPVNQQEAYKWTKKSAEQGFPAAEANLGVCYIMGWGVKTNVKTGLDWLKKAADSKNPFACAKLAELYLGTDATVKGIAPDLAKAEEMYQKAVEYGAEAGYLQWLEDQMEKVRTSPWVEMDSVKIEHHIVVDGVEGMNFKCCFKTHNMMKKKGTVNLYFYNNGGEELKDFNQAYSSTDGFVATHIDINPKFKDTLFTDLVLFLPYDELHLNDDYDADIQYCICVFCQQEQIFTGEKTVIPFKKVLKKWKNSKKVTFHKLWYEDSGGKFMRIHINFSVDHALQKQGRVHIWFNYMDGKPLLARPGSTLYSTPDGQVCVSEGIKPSYESTIWENFVLLIPYEELNITGDFTHNLKFQAGVVFGKEHLPYSNFINFSVRIKSGIFSTKYTLI